MKKQILTLLVLFFSIIISDQAGNNNSARTGNNGTNPVLKKDTLFTNASALFRPEDLGMSSKRLSRIDSIVKAGIKAKVFPGCQVLVLKEGKPVYDKCFGNYTYETKQEVKPTTMYDLASLSKTTGTLLAIMKLYDEGKLKLTDNASQYLTFLQGTDKSNITIKELLFHESGLPAGLPFYSLAIEQRNIPKSKKSVHKTKSGHTTKPTHTSKPTPKTKPAVATIPQVRKPNSIANSTFKFKEDWVSKIPSDEYALQVSDSFYVSNRFHQAAMEMIARAHLSGKTYCYSCINFILLKEIAETISGTTMDVFLDKEFYTPMNLNNLTYLPLRKHKKEDIAPTLQRDGLRNGRVQGYVNDPDAAFLGGVSGNAGLFATATDVASIYQMLLNNGELDGKRYLSEETCRLFTTTTSKSGRRDLGYDKPVPSNMKHNPCCKSAPQVVYGHTGYTGTCCWVDPVNRFVYVFLSNRTYPYDGVNKLAKTGIRTKIQELIYQSMVK